MLTVIFLVGLPGAVGGSLVVVLDALDRAWVPLPGELRLLSVVAPMFFIGASLGVPELSAFSGASTEARRKLPVGVPA
jgi:hypothetical protein